MALQIANPAVVAKVESLAKAMGITKTAAVERAVDQLLREQKQMSGREKEWEKIDFLLQQIDQLPRNENFIDPLQWDEHGLPI